MQTQLITIMARPEIPPTPESIAEAKRLNAQERERCTKETGLQFDADGKPMLHHPWPQYILANPFPAKHMLPVLTEGVDIETRVDCGEAIDALVEAHGFDAVLRSLRLVAAVNGWYLWVKDEEER